ncbi:MAG: radical SAM protein [Christensenellaceae bacterium]|jgi:DNA repair photolyase|nr:radical SAM protein [Christensenellaceae bacterium]
MHYARYKTILSPQNGMNLYRGCTHGCIYCDSRSHCYQIQHGFEDVEVKQDAIAILEGQLRRKRAPCMIGTGSMCDPYLPLEEELRLTRQSLALIERLGFGASVLTKSSRILRDLDLLCAINQRAKCVAQLTLTTFDETLCRLVEPGVSTTLERAGALQALRDRGIPTIVWLSPILPFLNDSEANLRGILSLCAAAGVRGILSFGFGMTLRAGSRDFFYQRLDELFPGLKAQYSKAFGESYLCPSPNEAALLRVFHGECERLGIWHEPKRIFAYLHAFEGGRMQTSLF